MGTLVPNLKCKHEEEGEVAFIHGPSHMRRCNSPQTKRTNFLAKWGEICARQRASRPLWYQQQLNVFVQRLFSKILLYFRIYGDMKASCLILAKLEKLVLHPNLVHGAKCSSTVFQHFKRKFFSDCATMFCILQIRRRH